MERIKQALDKQARLNSGKSLWSARQISSSQHVRHETAGVQIQDELDNVRYKQTRVVKLSAEHLEKNQIVAFNKNNAMSMNFDLLRTMVLKKMDEKGWRTLAITSPTPESGKTVVAINLAMSIAQQTNKTAMLVDFDLRRPKVGTYLGIPMTKSLNELLEGTAELKEVLINPDFPRLVVLPTRNKIKKSSETLSSRKIADLIGDLRDRYESRIIIFDLPPVLIIDDTLALLPQIDCVLLVVANGMSTKQEIEDSLLLIPADKLIGTVLNKVEIEKRDYY